MRTLENLRSLTRARRHRHRRRELYYRDDIDRARRLAGHGCTTWTAARARRAGSSAVLPHDRGEPDVVRSLDPIFATLAPGTGDAPRTPPAASNGVGRPKRAICTAARNGAGHFVKMVHTASSMPDAAMRRVEHPPPCRRRNRTRAPEARKCGSLASAVSTVRLADRATTLPVRHAAECRVERSKCTA